MEGAGVGSGGACLSGAILVGELAWEVALSGLFGGMDRPLSSVASQLGSLFFFSFSIV